MYIHYVVSFNHMYYSNSQLQLRYNFMRFRLFRNTNKEDHANFKA